MHYTALTSNQIPQIYETFVEAFSDYGVDVSYMTEEVIRNRSAKNGIDFNLSVGAFDEGKMVGFTLVGVDFWQDELSAFDIMTGITKPYRGQGIARKMFDFTLPKVKERGIKNFVLEVLQQNDAAIKTYSKTGFEIVRSFECFIAQTSQLKPFVRDLPDIGILSVGKDFLGQSAVFSDWKPSWENSINSLLRIPDDLTILGAFYQEKLVGILAYYPLIRWINLLAVDPSFRNTGIASLLIHQLLLSLEGKTSEIKVINVDSSDQALQALLVKTGFEKVTSQYEMCLKL